MAVENVKGPVATLDDDIYLIPGRPGGGCNVFVLKGAHKTMLIDVGLPGDYAYLCGKLEEIGLRPDDIHLVGLTHEHLDHVGCVPELPTHVLVAAHGRAATKIELNDQFSTMQGAFGADLNRFHVDIHLEDGTLIDLGGIKVRVVYTPGHCSGSICFYETRRGLLFTGDTIFSGGVLGGIFASGNTSDYIASLERLSELRLEGLYPGHGRMSDNPQVDLERAVQGSKDLLRDTRVLFNSIEVQGSFKQIMRATSTYSRRAAERRRDPRFACVAEGLLHEPNADHPVGIVNISVKGAKLDRALPLTPGSDIAVTIPELGRIESRVLGNDSGATSLEFLLSEQSRERLNGWLGELKKNAKPAR